ncbi:hypothetical protein NM688_g4045 [Phlebia brevispora]|uniref:Uncharacterized protein n=1 Tax=Phlebia brevispora TaxID=194682 RepID=A0ACC1T420_9APHY|nr:hypothetical protein NM688_g4045 [Phlebia brevispora]
MSSLLQLFDQSLSDLYTARYTQGRFILESQMVYRSASVLTGKSGKIGQLFLVFTTRRFVILPLAGRSFWSSRSLTSKIRVTCAHQTYSILPAATKANSALLCLSCEIWGHQILVASGISIIYTVHAILILRLYGLYGSKILMYTLSTLLCLAFAAELYVAVTFSPTFISVDLGPVIGNACVTENTTKMSFIWIPILTFEIIVFLLALYKGLEQLRNGAIQASRLMQVMIRDSFAYFFIIVAIDIVNLIAWIHIRATLRSVTFTFTGTLMSVLGSQMLMNIRLSARPQIKDLDTIEMLPASTSNDMDFRRPAGPSSFQDPD